MPVQEYKITLRRTTNGNWIVAGYWNVAPFNKPADWSLDGSALSFNSRKEALEHCLKATGVPD